MNSSLRPLTSVFATAFSLWFAVFACLLGCAQMTAADLSAVPSAVGNPTNPTSRTHEDLAADMGGCHHSSGSSPAPANGSHSGSRSSLSCCPLEVTLATKNVLPPQIHAVQLDAAALSDFLASGVHRTDQSRLASVFWRAGREILLDTKLLRI